MPTFECMKRFSILFSSWALVQSLVLAQPAVSEVWKPDLGNGKYQNPIIYADYSDPDVCASDDDFWMTASSFNCTPGLPILHSKDLVNWDIVNYALPVLEPEEVFDHPQHGKGVWAPCIRKHDGMFYIYWGDPDFGIYMIKTNDPRGEWSKPVLVKEGKGFIDPSPLWDDDGKAYLAHAYAGSRAGINSLLVIQEMTPDGTSVLGKPIMVFDGNDRTNHTCEGPKLYKKDGYYYILCPAGGVVGGWQLALRSKQIYGPYESKIVMAQGKSAINGPHQGGWVCTPNGDSWFIHFQDKGLYGRILHLNPMQWKNGWPVIGDDRDGDGCGDPVTIWKKPNVGTSYPAQTPADSDEFNSLDLGTQWQWHANYKDVYGFTNPYGFMRLYIYRQDIKNLWEAPNLLLQKFMAESFTATAKIKFSSKGQDERVGLIVMGRDYSYLSLLRKENGFLLEQSICKEAEQQTPETQQTLAELQADREVEGGNIPSVVKEIYLQVKVEKGGLCTFSYSFDGKHFIKAGTPFQAREGKWIGAKLGFFATCPNLKGGEGWVDIDWFRITP